MLALQPTIEFATRADLAAIAAMSRRYIEYGLGWKYTPACLAVRLRDAACNVVVARAGATVAGFGIMTYGEQTANLDLLAVRVGYRRLGLGRRLVRWLETVAGTAGISIVYVQVRSANAGAVRFYEALGFLAFDEIPGYYRGRESALVMGRTLAQLAGRGRVT